MNSSEQVTAGDLLRQISLGVLDVPHGEADQRLTEAATHPATWVSRDLIDRTAAVTVISIAGQAAGIGQADALAVARAAFRARGVE